MDWGLKNRLSRIIKPHNNRALMLAVDHGYFLGPTEKLENPKKVIAPILKYCDSLMVTRGVQRTSVSPTSDTPMVLRVSGGSSIIGDDLSQEDITVSIEEAIRLNASAVAMSIFVGSKYEYQTIVNLGKLVNEAEKYGMPVLAVTAVGKELGKDARYLSLACRVAAEQGAHIVKTYYCDNFEKVVQSCPVPIIVAGGKKIPERDALQLTYNAIKAGAVGLDMGRNIWQSEHPVAMIQAARSIIHGNSNVEQAYSLYKKLAAQDKPNNPNQKKSTNPNQNKSKKPNNPNQKNPLTLTKTNQRNQTILTKKNPLTLTKTNQRNQTILTKKNPLTLTKTNQRNQTILTKTNPLTLTKTNQRNQTILTKKNPLTLTKTNQRNQTILTKKNPLTLTKTNQRNQTILTKTNPLTLTKTNQRNQTILTKKNPLTLTKTNPLTLTKTNQRNQTILTKKNPLTLTKTNLLTKTKK